MRRGQRSIGLRCFNMKLPIKLLKKSRLLHFSHKNVKTINFQKIEMERNLISKATYHNQFTLNHIITQQNYFASNFLREREITKNNKITLF